MAAGGVQDDQAIDRHGGEQLVQEEEKQQQQEVVLQDDQFSEDSYDEDDFEEANTNPVNDSIRVTEETGVSRTIFRLSLIHI